MSIRPVDFNGIIQNTQGVAHNHMNEEHRPMLQQDTAQQSLAAEVERSHSQVQEQEDAGESGGLNADREGRGGGYRGKKGKKRPKKKEKEPDGSVSLKNASHPSFDMKI